MPNPEWTKQAEALKQRGTSTVEDINRWLRDFVAFIEGPPLPPNWQMTKRPPFGEGIPPQFISRWGVEMHVRMDRIHRARSSYPNLDIELFEKAVRLLLKEVFKTDA